MPIAAVRLVSAPWPGAEFAGAGRHVRRPGTGWAIWWSGHNVGIEQRRSVG